MGRGVHSNEEAITEDKNAHLDLVVEDVDRVRRHLTELDQDWVVPSRGAQLRQRRENESGSEKMSGDKYKGMSHRNTDKETSKEAQPTQGRVVPRKQCLCI